MTWGGSGVGGGGPVGEEGVFTDVREGFEDDAVRGVWGGGSRL